MKEFKFACPYCGQHITAAPGTSGAQISCPTCFQKLMVPQFSGDTKLVITAAKASGPRPLPEFPETDKALKTEGSKVGVIVVALVLCALTGVAYVFRQQLFPSSADRGAGKQPANTTVTVPPPSRPLSSWTTNLNDAQIPDQRASGMLKGSPFSSTRSVLQGGYFTLRQGKGSPPELAISIAFPAKHGEDLAGKTVLVSSTQQPPQPRVTLRWKNAEGKAQTRNFKTGYMLKLTFGEVTDGRMPGKLYISLPDEDKSFVAGIFNAEIRAPDPNRQSRPPKPPASG